MAHLVEALRTVAIMIRPFLTETPVKMFEQLGITDETHQNWESLTERGIVPAGTKVQKGKPIFPRLEMEEEVASIKAKMSKPEEKVEEESNEITFDEFTKVDLRVGEVLQAEKMKNADKLLKLQIDLGSEQRQIISGIAQYYEPEALVGRKVIVVANLKPVKLRGEMSEGMILSGEDEDGTLSLATVSGALPNGSVVK